MKSKKVTMLAAALVVAVVAAAGIGYAVNYTATTSNDKNSIDSTYMTIKQGGDAAYSKNFFVGITYLTENIDASHNKFTPVFDSRYDTSSNRIVNTAGGTEESPLPLNMAKISNDLELTIDTTKSKDTSVTLDVTVTPFTPQGMTYVMYLTNTDGTVVGHANYEANKWTFSLTVAANNSTDNVYNVALYVECTTPITIEGTPSETFNSAGFTNYKAAAGDNPAAAGNCPAAKGNCRGTRQRHGAANAAAFHL